MFEGIQIPLEVDVLDNLQNSVVKDYKSFMPGLKRKALFWEQKKDTFACEAGSAAENYNQLIID